MPRLEEFETYYLDENGESLLGIFKMRRLLAEEASALIDRCMRKNTRSGETLGLDDQKYARMRLASMIVDCPIKFEGKAWKDLETDNTRARAIGQKLEEDAFVALIQFSRDMRRIDEKTENL